MSDNYQPYEETSEANHRTATAKMNMFQKLILKKNGIHQRPLHRDFKTYEEMAALTK